MSRLSLDLSKYEAAVNGLHDEIIYTLHMQDEILKLFPPIHIIHVGTTRLVSSPNILDKPLKPYRTSISMEPIMFLQTDVSKFNDVILGWSTNLLDQLKKQTVEVMLETGEAAGHSIDAEGRNFWDAHIEMLQKAPYQEHGYTLYMNPDTEKKINEIQPTPEQRRMMKEVLREKREEFLANKRSRRLS